MSTKIGFEFPIDSAGQWDGFNDPGMEHFSGNPFQHLGREVPQNTIDAKIEAPVHISIALKRIKLADLPDVVSLRQVVERCAASAELDDSDKAKLFFDEAKSLLSKTDIQVLQISDSNTSGVSGPCVNGRPFFALLKATGQSKKGSTSTGSYGIGKFAPFTVSGLRTVFISTVWEDEAGGLHHYVQGKSVLMSFTDDEGHTHRGTGYWGVSAGCMPVEGINESVPAWLRRAPVDGDLSVAKGTTLSILGFSPVKGWQSTLTANIIENFFGAIKGGELVVDIENSHHIDATSLEGLLSNPDVIAGVSEQEGEPEKIQNVANYLEALGEGPSVVLESTENLHLGHCQLRILVGEKLPKKVAVLRNGMLITDSMQHLKRFGEFKDFVAILECTSEKGQALLRGMEPPRHDAFEPERLSPDKRAAGRNALRDIGKWVRAMLQRHAQDPVEEETQLNEMADFFADEAEEGAAKIKDENPGGAIIIRARPIKPKKNLPSYLPGNDDTLNDEDIEAMVDGSNSEPSNGDDAGGGAGGQAANDSHNDASGGDKAPEGGSGSQPLHAATAPVAIKNVRAVPILPAVRRVAFTPSMNGIARVRLEDSGADTNRPLAIVAATWHDKHDDVPPPLVEGGIIKKLTITAGKRCVLDVELGIDFEGTMRVVADAV